MKSGLKSRGFTIVEVLIFLAVSSALMVSAFALISGSQNKASFTQSINDVQQQMDSVINNVANGYYADSASFQECTVDVNGTLIFSNSPTAVTKGTSSQCIFLGRFIAFTDGSDEYTVYNVAGRRQISGKDVTKMEDANPKIIPDSQQTYKLKNGLTFKGTPNAFGFFNGLGKSSGVSDQLNSGYQQASFYGFSYINGQPLPTDFATGFNSDKNPPAGYGLCFNSGTTNQSGVITIGGNGRTATSSLEIRGTQC
jgi:type II secretory pathway pseudopilin PulG